MANMIGIKTGKNPEVIKLSSVLEDWQGYVGGYITYAGTPLRDVVVYCDEEADLKGTPYNCRLFGRNYRGNILIGSIKGTGNLRPNQLEEIMKLVEQEAVYVRL